MTDAFVSSRPVFKLAGEERDDLQDALSGLVVNLPLSGAAHAELQLCLWGRPEGAETSDFVLQDIGLGAELEILMGSTSLFSGEVTAIEERYGEGAPILGLLLQDKLHRLARLRHSRSFEQATPDTVAQTLAQDGQLQADAQISSLATTWHQLNESNLAFLLRIAGHFDIAVRFDGHQLRAKPEQPDPEPVELSAQDSALKIRLLADLNHQAQSTTVRGYNLSSAEDSEGSGERLTPAPDGQSAGATLSDLRWTSEELMVQPFARSQGEAEAYALAHFKRQAKRFIAGDIVCQGEPSLKSGREIRLSGVSPRFAGTYQVVHCVHRFDNQTGFETHLTVHKGGWAV